MNSIFKMRATTTFFGQRAEVDNLPSDIRISQTLFRDVFTNNFNISYLILVY